MTEDDTFRKLTQAPVWEAKSVYHRFWGNRLRVELEKIGWTEEEVRVAFSNKILNHD